MPVWKYHELWGLEDFPDTATTALTSNKLEEIYQKNIRDGTNVLINLNEREVANVGNVMSFYKIGKDYPEYNEGKGIRIEIAVPIPPMTTVLIRDIVFKEAIYEWMYHGDTCLKEFLEQFYIPLARTV